MVIGVLLLVVGAATTWWSVVWMRLWAVLRREPLRSPADLVGAAAAGALPPGPYVVGGTAAPGAAVLSSPINGDSCVWHRHVGTRTQVRTRVDDKGKVHRRTSRHRIADLASLDRFAVEGGGGAVRVHPDRMRVDRPSRGEVRKDLPTPISVLPAQKQPAKRPPKLRPDVVERYAYREWFIRPGTPLVVVGEAVADADGTVVVRRPPGAAPHLVSTRSFVRVGRRVAVLAVACTAGAVAAGVAGLGLVVAGLV
ncbi:hypothetical protein Val02_09880 [Virgisporangium aliadipatigenens]|uniref:RING-type E3 ubiquitin transferase n=1 Tax=Virgisporangium aliadipatigenens TaxID=741659 RepID=A0A8J3YGS0_9ACTN|nr:GIDE domain-containing protein [Virgisporangium aliadipatigenens]GIJ44102.1 hypothetical protein Val02_09880 [Virgisporangium aliadipatigenens]